MLLKRSAHSPTQSPSDVRSAERDQRPLSLSLSLEPKAIVCISATDRMRMFYLVVKKRPILRVHWRSNFKQ